jgi:hypothetical protein
LAELFGQQFIGTTPGLMIVGNRDYDYLFGAVGGDRLLDIGANLRRGADEPAALAA